jgi:hypothetical protein
MAITTPEEVLRSMVPEGALDEEALRQAREYMNHPVDCDCSDCYLDQCYEEDMEVDAP